MPYNPGVQDISGQFVGRTDSAGRRKRFSVESKNTSGSKCGRNWETRPTRWSRRPSRQIASDESIALGHLRRSYQIFLVPDYRPSPAVVNAAISAVQKAGGVSRTEAEARIAGMLDKNSRALLGDFPTGRGKVSGKDVSSLMQRQDLLSEIRTRLGEVKDPILAVNQTIPRMARMIEMDAAQKAVRGIGTPLGLFSDARSMTHPAPLLAEGSQTHDVLAGLYAAPEIAAAFQEEAGLRPNGAHSRGAVEYTETASSAAKLAKNVGNPKSYAPIFIGGIIANIANANSRYTSSARGLALGAEELGALRQLLPASPSRDALRSELPKLHKLGVRQNISS